MIIISFIITSLLLVKLHALASLAPQATSTKVSLRRCHLSDIPVSSYVTSNRWIIEFNFNSTVTVIQINTCMHVYLK